MQIVILREEIEIPSNVNVDLKGSVIKMKGPKGEVVKDFSFARGIQISLDGNKIVLETTFANRRKKAVFYSIVSHIKNMITGVTKGYRYYLKIIYTHFPTSVKVVGNEVQITNLIGEKNIRRAPILPGVKVTVKGEDIVVEGPNLDAVAQTAANIEAASKITGFDRRIFSDGIFIYKKEVVE
ncbi:50S ribosomal protein L6 [Saccharolobus shibatae]|uniref:Large ribosomal subunit protein uL6 n=1 Tax=Saccharolobus shibatae TaxID=2286 RepID=A0A8F5BX50_9CREN|nr:50S ribosomal protein L6 [Saccharolobus shibatae]QXJ33057.1 LSU ribosomal protein L9e (L6p) [Saccharolobus shibatae]